jgi:hypothetical protein
MNTEPKVLSLSIKKKGITVTYLDRRLNDEEQIIETEVKALLRGKAKRPAQTSITDPDQLVNEEQGEYAENERD